MCCNQFIISRLADRFNQTSSFEQWFGNLHEKYELDDRRPPQELTEGVHKEVIGQQGRLDQQHQGIVSSLEHLRGLIP